MRSKRQHPYGGGAAFRPAPGPISDPQPSMTPWIVFTAFVGAASVALFFIVFMGVGFPDWLLRL